MMSKEEIKELIAKNISGQGNQVDMGSALPTILNAMLENGGGGVTSITYAELKTMRDNGTLQAGSFYRITDYHTTTTQEGTQSADHQFDVIVLALTENTLSEEAYAIQHEGDEYFSTSNLNAWKLMYCLDNDADRFMWADAEGKGVIFRMIDEYGNDCPYDFKNIMFIRTFDEDLRYDPDGSYEFFAYTFNWFDWSAKGQDASIIGNDGTLKDEDEQIIGVYGNTMKPCYSYDHHPEDQKRTMQYLNNNVFYSSPYPFAMDVFSGCYNNTFGNNCYNNTFYHSCNSNTFGNGCYSNTFEDNCSDNTFGENCYSNTFGYICHSNTFGSYCHSNELGNGFRDNTIGNKCNNNTGGDWVFYLTMFDGVEKCNIKGGTGSGRSSVQNAQILNGTHPLSGNSLTITFQAGKNYTQVAGLNSNGTLKIWSPADKV